MSTSALVVKPRLKTFRVAVFVMSLGIVSALMAPAMVGSECSGRRRLLCDMLHSLPVWLHFSLWVGFGLLCAYLGAYTLVRMFRGTALLSLGEEGIGFDLGGSVLVPWDDVASVSVSRSALTVMGRTPRRIRYVYGRRKETDKFVIPFVMGRAYVDGEFRWWSAASNVKKWLGERGSVAG